VLSYGSQISFAPLFFLPFLLLPLCDRVAGASGVDSHPPLMTPPPQVPLRQLVLFQECLSRFVNAVSFFFVELFPAGVAMNMVYEPPPDSLFFFSLLAANGDQTPPSPIHAPGHLFSFPSIKFTPPPLLSVLWARQVCLSPLFFLCLRSLAPFVVRWPPLGFFFLVRLKSFLLLSTSPFLPFFFPFFSSTG